jgi:hypothetical protein
LSKPRQLVSSEPWWDHTDVAVLDPRQLKQRTTVYRRLLLAETAEKLPDGRWCHTTGTHWIGTYSQVRGGYCKVTVRELAEGSVLHKLIWQWMVGPVPLGMTLDHRCNEVDAACRTIDKRCCNPAHIEIVSEQENSRRRIIRDRGLVFWGYGDQVKAVAPQDMPPRETWVQPVVWAWTGEAWAWTGEADRGNVLVLAPKETENASETNGSRAAGSGVTARARTPAAARPQRAARGAATPIVLASARARRHTTGAAQPYHEQPEEAREKR